MALAELLTSPYFVAALFFVIAFTYSSVGLGGGSSYTALMAILGFNALVIPTLSLVLNMVVTSVGSLNFIRYRHAKFSLIAPFLLSSMPMAYLGGALRVSTELFNWVLTLSLIFVALRIYVWKDTSIRPNLGGRGKTAVALLAGAVLGLLAGIVGIGGGIYLVPLVIILGLGTQKEAAACGAVFVWLNSLSGLLARVQYNTIDLGGYIPLIGAVLLGGALGSLMGASRYSQKTMERTLGIVIIVAILFMLRKLLGPPSA